MAGTKNLADGVIGWEERGRKKRLRKLLANVKGKDESPKWAVGLPHLPGGTSL